MPTLKLWAVLVSRALTFVNFLKRWLNSHQYGFLRSVLNCPQRLKKTTTRLHSHPSFPESSLISCLSAGLAGLRSTQEKKEVVFWGFETHQIWDQPEWWLWEWELRFWPHTFCFSLAWVVTWHSFLNKCETGKGWSPIRNSPAPLKADLTKH